MSILDEILVNKRLEVAVAKNARSFAEIDASARWLMAAAQNDPTGGAVTRGLQRALTRAPGEPVRVLAEIKRASPSAGPIRAGADPATIARQYDHGGAAALSVLTDQIYFDGDLAFLARVRNVVALPLLRKDFIVDSYQVAEARAAGADAVLLIVAALSPAQLSELLAAAAQYQLDALVEVHTVKEAEVALAANISLLGVNHRDLGTFSIDMSLTSIIAPMCPPDVVLVAESGIKTNTDVLLLGSVGAHAVLVGEQLMRQPDPGVALRALRGESP